MRGVGQQQRAVGRGRDFLRAEAGAVRHVGRRGEAEAQQQLGGPSSPLPVPADGPLPVNNKTETAERNVKNYKKKSKQKMLKTATKKSNETRKKF